MKTTVEYTDEAEKQAAIQANSGLYLVEEQLHGDGNFFVFDDVPLPETPPENIAPLSELAQMRQELDTLKTRMTAVESK